MRKNKQVTRDELQPGMQVVVNPAPDTQLYTVKEVHGFLVKLIYYAYGQEIQGGAVDYSVCLHPTDDQLNHALIYRL